MTGIRVYFENTENVVRVDGAKEFFPGNGALLAAADPVSPATRIRVTYPGLIDQAGNVAHPCNFAINYSAPGDYGLPRFRMEGICRAFGVRLKAKKRFPPECPLLSALPGLGIQCPGNSHEISQPVKYNLALVLLNSS